MGFYSLDLTDYVHIYIPYLDICALVKNYDTSNPKYYLPCLNGNLIFFNELIGTKAKRWNRKYSLSNPNEALFQSLSSKLTEVVSPVITHFTLAVFYASELSSLKMR